VYAVYDILINPFMAFLEATTVIVLRAHYTMDVLAAACAAWCAAIAAGWLCAFF